jgi:hypothetical protein
LYVKLSLLRYNKGFTTKTDSVAILNSLGTFKIKKKKEKKKKEIRKKKRKKEKRKKEKKTERRKKCKETRKKGYFIFTKKIYPPWQTCMGQ